MEVLAVVGGAAACLQLADGFIRLSRKLYRAIKLFRNAQQLLCDLRDETSLFATCLKSVVHAAERAYGGDGHARKRHDIGNALRYVIRQGRWIKSTVRRLLRDVGMGPTAGTVQQWIGKLRWSWQQKRVQFLKNSLSKAKLDVSLLTLTVRLDLLLQTISQFQADGLEVPKELATDVALIVEEAKMYEKIAAETATRLLVLSKAISPNDSLVRNVADIIHASENLERLVQTTLSDVLPRANTVRTPRTRSRRSPSERSRQTSARASEGELRARSVATHETAPSPGSSRAVVVAPRGERIDEALETRSGYLNISPANEVGRLSPHESRRTSRTNSRASSRAHTGSERASRIEISGVEHRRLPNNASQSKEGHIIRVDQDNRVEERYGRWSSVIDVSHDDGNGNPPLDSSVQEEADHVGHETHIEEPDGLNHPDVTDGEEAIEHGHPVIQPDVEEAEELGPQDEWSDSSHVERPHGSVSSIAEHSHRSKRHMSPRISEAVEIFSPEDQASDPDERSEKDDERWEPMPPFNRQDGSDRGRKRSPH